MSIERVKSRIVRGVAPSVMGLLLVGLASQGSAYPGGTPDFQTDVAPFCASCHSSTSAVDLAGAGERADKELGENKHLAALLEGKKGYAELSEAERKVLAEQIRALDAASTVEIDHPAQVEPGSAFQVTVRLTGGAGPVVGLALVDRAHRWHARPASAVGWSVVGAPTIIGTEGRPQTSWLERRPERSGRGITYVNITGVESNAATGSFASTKVIFTLQAPDRPGSYPLVAAFLYGTEKASPLGYTMNPLGYRQTRGGFTGNSGRVRFSAERMITVKAGDAPQ